MINRLMRSVPLIGLVAHVFQHDERLRAARLEDEAYVEMMAALDEPPRFRGASQARERHVSVGQLAGFLLANLAGLSAVGREVAWQLIVPLTCLGALLLDAALSRVGGALHDWGASRAFDERRRSGVP